VQIIIGKIGFNWVIQAQIGASGTAKRRVHLELQGCKEKARKTCSKRGKESMAKHFPCHLIFGGLQLIRNLNFKFKFPSYFPIDFWSTPLVGPKIGVCILFHYN